MLAATFCADGEEPSFASAARESECNEAADADARLVESLAERQQRRMGSKPYTQNAVDEEQALQVDKFAGTELDGVSICQKAWGLVRYSTDKKASLALVASKLQAGRPTTSEMRRAPDAADASTTSAVDLLLADDERKQKEKAEQAAEKKATEVAAAVASAVAEARKAQAGAELGRMPPRKVLVSPAQVLLVRQPMAMPSRSTFAAFFTNRRKHTRNY